MINKILVGILGFISTAINFLLSPINNLIAQNFPSVQTAINNILTFLNTCVSSIGWVISAVGIESGVITLVVTVLGLRLVWQPIVHAVKYIIKWYKTIMP